MFDKLREKWRKERESEARKNAAFDTIKTGYPDNVVKALRNLTTGDWSENDRGWALKLAIDRQDATVFKEVLAYVGDPTIQINYYETRNDHRYDYSFTPITYALTKARSHDISLQLASHNLTRFTDDDLSSAKDGGMHDVAAVIARRIAEVRRAQAGVLDAMADMVEGTPAKPVPPEKPAAPVIDDTPKVTEDWALMSPTSVARVTGSAAIGRKLTEIFNFESRERVLITENLKTGVESIGVAEPFEKLHPDTVKKAEAALRKLLGVGEVKPFNP